MGTIRIANKIESLAVGADTKVSIPVDGLNEYTAYEISVYVDGSHAAFLIHPDATGQATGHRIPSGGVATYGPVEVGDMPAVYAESGKATDVVISYASVPEAP